MDMMVLKLKNKSFLSNVNENINILCKFVLKQFFGHQVSLETTACLGEDRVVKHHRKHQLTLKRYQSSHAHIKSTKRRKMCD